MGFETALWVRRDAFFTFGDSHSFSYGSWFATRLWRITFRNRLDSHLHRMFLLSLYVPSLMQEVSRNWGICVCVCVWQVMYDATGVRLHAGRQAEVFLFFLFCFLQSFGFLFTDWFISRFSIRLCMDFLQSIRSLKAYLCVNFLVILLHK